ncbi:hypothetical protein CASFOL_003053 [Castilleja foliolosa]|uniref:N-acetyltransferase domain-containing protein n=1 Tax=Castilleja foliolosa TaxID=1961234 RepID=A0ABD3EG27_9LAMI
MAATHSWYLSTNFGSISPSPPKIAAQFKPKSAPPPIYISTNPSHVNPNHLRELYAACNLSGHRFPTVDAAGRVELIDELKLHTALSHSSLVVSVFTKPELLTARSSNSTDFIGIGGDWIRKVAPVTPENGRLIGFGRAVSDLALTASIYDVMVHPDLQGRGIGRMIVKRIVRMLINRDSCTLYLKRKLFLKSCGFGDDIMGSTTMMYTRSASSYSEDKQIVSAGLYTSYRISPFI